MPLLVTLTLTNPLRIANIQRSMAMLVHGHWALLHYSMHGHGMERKSVSAYSSAHYHDRLLNINQAQRGTKRMERWMSC